MAPERWEPLRPDKRNAEKNHIMSIEDIVSDFEFLDDWEDRYRYVIELGKALEPLDENQRNDINKVNGCVSQVWLHCVPDTANNDDPILNYTGDSDALIVRGLIAILFVMFSGKPASEILKLEPVPILNQLGLQEHLTPQRSNGLFSMVERIKKDAAKASETTNA